MYVCRVRERTIYVRHLTIHVYNYSGRITGKARAIITQYLVSYRMIFFLIYTQVTQFLRKLSTVSCF